MKICLHYIISVTQTYTLMTKLCSWSNRWELLFRAQFSTCCLSILIDLSFDRQYHNITPVHVFIVGFCARRSFLNAWDRYILRDFFVKSLADANQESVTFPILGNSVEPLSENFIGILINLYFAWCYHIHCGLRGFVEY